MNNVILKMKPKRFFLLFLAIATMLTTLTGCGSKSEIPYPSNYFVPQVEESEAETEGDIVAEESAVSKADTVEEIAKTSIHYLLDTSGSMKRSTKVITIHSAATKCAAGYKNRYYYGLNESGTLVETTEQLALSGQYGNGAPIDLIERDPKNPLPYDSKGLNIMTTDLQTNTDCSKLGRWLVDTGSSGFSFYVFKIPYNGYLEFETFTSNSVFQQVSIKDCNFKEREFLMIVFGDNTLVEDFDETFQYKLDADIKFDLCHVSLNDSSETVNSYLSLNSSRCFNDDIANVTYTNTNYNFGLTLLEPENVDFTCENTFVYKKSSKSASTAKEAVKAVLYAVPTTPVPNVQEVMVSNVLKFDEDSESYKPSDVPFKVSTCAYLDGLPAANESPESEIYERLNKSLGGPIVAEDPVFTITVENENLPKGLFALEAQVVFEPTGQAKSLQAFSTEHSAGLEEYVAALKTECVPRATDGQDSNAKFTYTGNGKNSVYCKLLEFEKVADELIAAGAVGTSEHETITIRVIIDNR